MAAFDLFQAPPTSREKSKEEEQSSSLDLFTRPPSQERPPVPTPEPTPEPEPQGIDLFSRPPGTPSRPTPTPEPQRQPQQRQRQPAQPDDGFTQEERAAFNQFAAPPRKFRNPDTQREVQFGSLPDPEQVRVRREWLQRFRQSQQQQQQQPAFLRNPKEQVKGGDILKSHTGREIKVDQVLDNGNIKYRTKKRDGSWADRVRTMRLSTFVAGRHTLKERPEPQQQAPEPEPQQPEQASPPPKPEGYETVSTLSEFKVGDKFYEEGVRDGEELTVRETRKGALRAENGIWYYADEVEKQGEEGYLRKPAPTQPEAPVEPEGERSYGPVSDPNDLREGDLLKVPRRYSGSGYYLVRRLGDRLVATEIGGYRPGEFPNAVHAEFLRPGSERVPLQETPYRFQQRFQRGIPPIAKERVRDPKQMAETKGLIRVGEGDDEKQYYVFGADGDKLKVQEYDAETKRPYGRPKEISAQDLKDKEHFLVQRGLPQRRKPPGDRLTGVDRRVRPGKVLKLYYDKKPTWARVVSVDQENGTMSVQRVNARNGRDIGGTEELSRDDLRSWAHVRRIARLPARLQPPPEPLVGPDGEQVEFAEKGQGELRPNFQPNRYDDVKITTSSGAAEDIRRLLGDRLGDRDPIYTALDLAGAGGIANSLSHVRVRASQNYISVSGSGPGVRNMDRTIYFQDGRPISISNSLFKVKGRRGRGIGTKMLATQVAMAREMGFEQINVQAAGSPGGMYRGYYAWPALGYTAAFPSGRWRNMPSELQAKILEVYPRKPGQGEQEMPQGLEFVHVMSAGKDVREWWRNNGRGMGMTFPLGDDSLSVKALTKYVREKGDAAGVGADEFLQRAASLNILAILFAAEKDESETEEVNEAPKLTSEDEKILDKVWDEMRKEMTNGR